MSRPSLKPALALIAGAALALAAPAAAGAADTRISFDGLPDHTFLHAQYANVEGPGRGVDFAPILRPGGVPDFGAPRLRAYAGAPSSPNILDISGCWNFICTPGAVGHFSDTRAWVAV